MAPLRGTTLIVMLLVLVQMYRIMGRGELLCNMHSSTALSFFVVVYLWGGVGQVGWGQGEVWGGRVKGY